MAKTIFIDLNCLRLGLIARKVTFGHILQKLLILTLTNNHEWYLLCYRLANMVSSLKTQRRLLQILNLKCLISYFAWYWSKFKHYCRKYSLGIPFWLSQYYLYRIKSMCDIFLWASINRVSSEHGTGKKRETLICFREYG